MNGKALLRVYAQIGDNVLLYQLGDGEVTSHADVVQKLRDIADAYEQLTPEQLPPLTSST